MRRIALLTAALLVALGIAVPALAATTTGIGTFGPLSGSSTSYATTMQIPATGFPQASVTSTSRSGGVGPQSGASMWFGAATDPGAEYGSSQDQPYVNFRPKADTPTSPSVTRYTFQRGTPQGWGFVLGDVDADKVTISATKADGTAASAADLGFQSVFNMCDTSPKPSGCSGVVAPFDLPSWDAATRTLDGNATALDTTGAAGWFKPTTSLRTLTFTFSQRAGFPVYQTWFAVKKQDIAGTVTVAGTCSAEDLPVQLFDPTGVSIGSTTTGSDGSYSFTGMSAGPGYHVELGNLPNGCVTDDAVSSPIDLSSGDGSADFAVREIVPLPISGTVKDDDGNPLAGVTVSIDDGTNPVRTATTGSDGSYLFDTNPVGTYSLSVTPPAGYTVGTAPGDVVVADGDEEPITERNFVLNAAPSVSGTVTDSDGGVGGQTVVLLDGPTEIARTTTGADGTYSFDLVPAGSYTVAVPEPGGDYVVPTPEAAAVNTADVTGVDLFLARPGSIAGTVTKGGAPVPGATITITGPSSFAEDLTTDAEGNYAIGELSPGTYTVTITPPEGTTIDDPSQEIVIPPGGEDFGAVDFAIEDVDTPDPDPGTPGGAGGGSGDGDALPDTGGPAEQIGILGLALLVAGAGLVAAARFAPSGRGDGGHRA